MINYSPSLTPLILVDVFLKSQCNTDKSILENKIGEADTKTPDTN